MSEMQREITPYKVVLDYFIVDISLSLSLTHFYVTFSECKTSLSLSLSFFLPYISLFILPLKVAA